MEVVVKGIYKHFKGDLYLVEDIGYSSETDEKLVIYRSLYEDSKLWIRPYNSFVEEVNRNGQKYRFEKQYIKSLNKKK